MSDAGPVVSPPASRPSTPSVVVCEAIHPEGLELLRAELGEAAVHADPELHRDRDELAARLAGARALVVRNRCRVDADLLAAAPELRVVGRLGVGLDNLDLAALRARDVNATWAPGANAASVAEYVMGALLHRARRYAEVSSDLHAGRWDRRAAIGDELLETTLGVVGLGDIGLRLARRARAFGMRVLASDPALHGSSYAVQEVEADLVGLDELLARSDAVSLHAPLTPATRHLIGAEQLARMRPHALLVNTARGGLIDEAALAEALRRGRPGGAVLDVRETEPPGDDDPLRGLPNVTLTPHVAGVTEAANRRVSRLVAGDVLRALRGERPRCPVPDVGGGGA